MSESASTVRPEEAQQCFHAMLLGQPTWPATLDGGFCSPSQLCLKSGSTEITFLYLGSLNLLYRARLALEKYVSASPSHPEIREDRSPASRVMYFPESCSCFKADSIPLRYHPCTCRKTDNCATMYVVIML